jgi:hypothetical protein
MNVVSPVDELYQNNNITTTTSDNKRLRLLGHLSQPHGNQKSHVAALLLNCWWMMMMVVDQTWETTRVVFLLERVHCHSSLDC